MISTIPSASGLFAALCLLALIALPDESSARAHFSDLASATMAEDSSRQAENTDTLIYDITSLEAVYPGGNDKILRDVSRNFSYPALARENGITGKVLVEFVVEKDGSISNIKIKKGLGYGIDEEVVKAVKKLKHFKYPARNGKNNPVRSYYPLSINLELN